MNGDCFTDTDQLWVIAARLREALLETPSTDRSARINELLDELDAIANTGRIR